MQMPFEIQTPIMDESYYDDPIYYPYLWHIQAIHNLLVKVPMAERIEADKFFKKFYSYLFIKCTWEATFEPGVFLNLTEKTFLRFESVNDGSIPAKTFCRDFFIMFAVLIKFYSDNDNEIWSEDFLPFIQECEEFMDMTETIFTKQLHQIHEISTGKPRTVDSPYQGKPLVTTKPVVPKILKWMLPLENKILAECKFSSQINWGRLDSILQKNTNPKSVLSLMAFQETWSEREDSDYMEEFEKLMQEYGNLKTLQNLIISTNPLPDYHTLLNIATEYEFPESFRYLVHASAEPDLHMLFCAVKIGDFKLVNHLVNGFGLIADADMLKSAIDRGHLEIVQLLVGDKNLKVDAEMLLQAVKIGNLELLKLLAPRLSIDLPLLKKCIDKEQIIPIKYLVASAKLDEDSFLEILEHAITITKVSSGLLTILLWDRFGLFNPDLMKTLEILKQKTGTSMMAACMTRMMILKNSVENEAFGDTIFFAWEYKGIMDPFVDDYCQLLSQEPQTVAAAETGLEMTNMLRKIIRDDDYPTLLIWVWRTDGLNSNFIIRMHELLSKDSETQLAGEILLQNSKLITHAAQFGPIKELFSPVCKMQGLFGGFVDDCIAILLKDNSTRKNGKIFKDNITTFRQAIKDADYTKILIFMWQQGIEEVPLNILKPPEDTAKAEQTIIVLAKLHGLIKQLTFILEDKALTEITSEILREIRPSDFKRLLDILKRCSIKMLKDNVLTIEQNILPILRPYQAQNPNSQFAAIQQTTVPPTPQRMSLYRGS